MKTGKLSLILLMVTILAVASAVGVLDSRNVQADPSPDQGCYCHSNGAGIWLNGTGFNEYGGWTSRAGQTVILNVTSENIAASGTVAPIQAWNSSIADTGKFTISPQSISASSSQNPSPKSGEIIGIYHITAPSTAGAYQLALYTMGREQTIFVQVTASTTTTTAILPTITITTTNTTTTLPPITTTTTTTTTTAPPTTTTTTTSTTRAVDSVTVQVSPTTVTGTGSFTVSGAVTAASGTAAGTAVLVQVENPSGTPVAAVEATVTGSGASGSYSVTIQATGTGNWIGGTYTVTASYASLEGTTPTTASTTFAYALTTPITTSTVTISGTAAESVVNGQPVISASYTNTASSSLSVWMWVNVLSSSGASSGYVYLGSATMSAGQTVSIGAVLLNLPHGTYTAQVFVTTILGTPASTTSTTAPFTV